MKKKLKSILSWGYILLTVVVVLVLGIVSDQFDDAFEVLGNMYFGWVALMFLVMGIFYWFEGYSLYYFLDRQGYPVTIRSNMKVALIGLYYSCITPFATGGQPMQIYYYHKDGVPYGAATSVLSVKFFCYQVASVGLSLIALLFAADYIMENIPSAMIFIIIGFISNGSSIVGLLLIMLKPNLARRIVAFFVRLLAKMHIIKHQDELLSKLDGIVEEYFEAIQFAKKKPKKTLMVILMSAIQILCMMVVSYFIYQALGLQGAPLWLFICLQLLLYTAVSFVPMPGASGAQEFGFYMLFQGIFPQDKLVIVMVLWRFFTYYLSLCIGGIVTAADSVVSNVRRMLHREPPESDGM